MVQEVQGPSSISGASGFGQCSGLGVGGFQGFSGFFRGISELFKGFKGFSGFSGLRSTKGPEKQGAVPNGLNPMNPKLNADDPP